MGNNGIWKRPMLNPLPVSVKGCRKPVVSLNGSDWKWNPEPKEGFWNDRDSWQKWENILVPQQTKGGNGEYAYKKILHIPEEWNGKRLFLRFDGANCQARVWIDGNFVKSHYGGFVSWDCEITEQVENGGIHELTIGMMDRPVEVSPFHCGGIIRDVYMYALPRIFLTRFHADTMLTDGYQDAILTVETEITGGCAEIELFLGSPDGEIRKLGTVSAEADVNQKTRFKIKAPHKWDSEHPWLYQLTAVLKADGAVLERTEKKIGFRQIEKRGNKVLLNGDVLKLRGINRHDIHPVTGRSLTHELVEEDVRLLKEANINFVRTSHYPPRPDFLELCDQYGIYVEDEIAVAFLGYGSALSQDDPSCREQYLGQFAEMVERDKSHPCVIIWSLANESYWGENHELCLQYVKQEDPDRLTIFSYPMTWKEDDTPLDLWSTHYGNWDSPLDVKTECFRRSICYSGEMPVLHDESTHIPCYDIRALKRDPAIRDFWGETIGRFWERLWETEGALGCAVWAGIDDVMIRDGIPQGFIWGIIDGWRRKKPEYWHIRKGYSPIVLPKEPQKTERGIELEIYNRFNHTNLNEVTVEWSVGEQRGRVKGPDAEPGTTGILFIPAAQYHEDVLFLNFSDSFGFCVEERALPLNRPKVLLPALSGKAPGLGEYDDEVCIYGENFKLFFSKNTGMITAGYDRETLVITGGPYLQLTGMDLEPWSLKEMKVVRKPEFVRIILNGGYGKVDVVFTIDVDNSGLLEVSYRIQNMPYPSPHRIAVTSSITAHQGGYDEVGVAFNVSGELDTLTWKRKGLWDVYPDWHIGRLEGETQKYNPAGINEPDTSPEWEWKQDEFDWALFGRYEIGRRGTRDFTSMKAYIEKAALKNKKAAFVALSDTRDSVRMEVQWDRRHLVYDNDPAVIYCGEWFQKKNRHHSFGGMETWSGNAGDWCSYTFVGTGIVWYTGLDRICGTADVYVDGHIQAEGIDLGCTCAGKDARGYRKHYRYPVFAIDGLPMGEHTLKIVVTGKKAEKSYNSYVIIDAFLILDGEKTGETRFIIDNAFNYPEISWANYSKPPILVETGYTGKVYVAVGERQEE